MPRGTRKTYIKKKNTRNKKKYTQTTTNTRGRANGDTKHI